MARSKSVVQSSASVELVYQYADEMPWLHIEKAAGKSFAKEDRQEIHGCFEAYCGGFDMVDQAVAEADIRDLQFGLVAHCKAIRELADKFKPNGDVATTLSRAYSNRGNELRDQFVFAVEAAEKILACLENGLSEDFEIDPSSASAHTSGLRDFCDKAIRGAIAVPARGSHANHVKARDGIEYERWGIAIGPRCKGFPEFVSAVIGKQVTSDQLRNAWPRPPSDKES